MHQVPLALAKLFEELGGEIQCDSEVDSLVIENRTAKGVRLKDGTKELFNLVVSNRDLPGSYRNFVNEKDRARVSNNRIKNWNYGCSAVLFYCGMKKKVKGYQHHNIVLSDDYKKTLREIFDQGILPDDPVLYVCSPTQTDATLAPKGKDIVYVLALAPNLNSHVDWQREVKKFRERVIKRIQKSGFEFNESDIELERVFTPMDFNKRYGTYYGNGFGLAPDFFQSACFRPMTKSKDIKNFYHVGASTHPGGGVPMVITSGRLVAEQIERHCPQEAGRPSVRGRACG
jgi:phytoene desaturase